MIDHVKIQFVPEFHALVPLTRLATPCFIILFGAMVEIAYLSKLRVSGTAGGVRRRMLRRLITCWGLAALLTLAAMASGNLDVVSGVKSVFGLAFGRFNEIFLIYAALFLVLLVLFPILARRGSALILALAAFGWLLRPYLNEFIVDPSYATTFLLGVGSGYGPAVLPALTFLGFGLALGETLTGHRGPALSVLLCGLALAVLLVEVQHGPIEAGRRFLSHRWTNHPGYYAVGILAFCGLALCVHLAYRLSWFAAPLQGLAVIGGQTLFMYGAGNFVLNALPVDDLAPILGAGCAGMFLAGLIALTLVGPERRNGMAFGIPRLWSELYGACLDRVTGFRPGRVMVGKTRERD